MHQNVSPSPDPHASAWTTFSQTRRWVPTPIAFVFLVHLTCLKLSFCFGPVEGPRSYSFVDTPFETAPGWTNSAPPSPLTPMYNQESATDWRTLASPGLLSIADDCALCGVDLDVSCLDALDEQLLLSPVECFSELCWASAVQDEVTAPVMRQSTRSRARSFHRDCEPASPPPLARGYPGSFERMRPLAARIAVPLEVVSSTPP